ncbi:MAG: hypothetical protein H6Q18_276 [Bacteroidetes bacterium]|nr:hypothetical protein [Bacteroidota bacterium]
MEEKKLNEKESLELISQMIKNTQQKLERHNGMPFLVWGYASVFVSVLIWTLLKNSQDYHWQFLWFLIPIIGYPTMMFFLKKEDVGVKTYIDKIISYIWISFAVAGFVVSTAAIFYWNIPILFIVLLLMSTGTAITGLVIQFKPLIFSGFLSILLSFGCLVVKGFDSILIFALVFLLMMVVPGHILNYKNKKNNV